MPDPSLDYLIDPSFQGVITHFVLAFENSADRTGHPKYYLKTLEIKGYNVMIDKQKSFDQPVDLRTYDNIRRTAINQGDYYITGCLLHYKLFQRLL